MKHILFLMTSLATVVFARELIGPSQEVKRLLSENRETQKYTYCIPNTQTCRTLVMFKNSRSFYNVFVSKERNTGASEYFLANRDGSFRSYLDESTDQKINIEFADPKNSHLRVTYDSKGFPTVHNALLKKHGSTKFALADLIFAKDSNVIVGTEFDQANAAYKVKLNIFYSRQH